MDFTIYQASFQERCTWYVCISLKDTIGGLEYLSNSNPARPRHTSMEGVEIPCLYSQWKIYVIREGKNNGRKQNL